jgi:hypothetical protein
METYMVSAVDQKVNKMAAHEACPTGDCMHNTSNGTNTSNSVDTQTELWIHSSFDPELIRGIENVIE